MSRGDSKGDRAACGDCDCPTNPRAGGNSQAGNEYIYIFFFWQEIPFSLPGKPPDVLGAPSALISHTNTLQGFPGAANASIPTWAAPPKIQGDFWDPQEPARLGADGGRLGAP